MEKENIMDNKPFELPLGTVLAERYEIGPVIGSGGFGITYRGVDRKLNMKVAVKEYYPASSVHRYHTQSLEVAANSDEDQILFDLGKKKFVDEARTLALFADDPGVVGVRDVFSDNNTEYLVMEYLTGKSLREVLKENGPLSFSKAFSLLSPVMDSLQRIHEQGLIHRDISPSNLMLLKNGKVKILDFGTARQSNEDSGKSLSVILKPGFAPLEQYSRNGKQGPWSDIYALCATIYKLITGKTPENSINRMGNDTLPRPSSLGATILPEEEAVLLKGMSVRAEERYQSMRALKEAFAQAGTQSPVSGNSSEPEDDEKTSLYNDAGILSDSKASRPEENKSSSLERPASVKNKPQDKSAESKESGTENDAEEKNRTEKKKEKPGKAGNLRKQKNTSSKTANKKVRFRKRMLLVCAVAAAIVAAALFLYAPTNPYYRNSENSDFENTTVTADMIKAVNRDTATKTITFSHCVITEEALAQLSKNKRVTSLDFYSCEDLPSLGVLTSMPALETLTVKGGYDNYLSVDMDTLFPKEMPGITNLSLLDLDVTSDSEFLSRFPSLEYLYFNNTSGTDNFSSLESLKNLVSVNITDSRDNLNQADLTNLQKCEQLGNLTLVNDQLTDISFVSGLRELSNINLNNNQIASLEPLAENESLNYLEAVSNALTNLNGLEQKKNLLRLDVSDNQITDLSPLREDDAISTLTISNNQITDLSPLSGMNLGFFTADHNQIADLTPLSGSSDMRNLSVNHNQLTTLHGCEQMILLSSVYASDNAITDISGLTNCTQLENVYLAQNQITDLSVLAKSADKLTDVMLDDNQIADPSALKGTTALEGISIANNQLTDLNFLSQSAEVKVLIAYNNQISSIRGLSDLRSLYYVDLGDNQISDLSPLSENAVENMALLLQNNQISDLSDLNTQTGFRYLTLYGNPLEDLSILNNELVAQSDSAIYLPWVGSKQTTDTFSSQTGFRYLKLVDVPLDQQANLMNAYKESSETYLVDTLEFLTSEQADEEVNTIREEIRHDSSLRDTTEDNNTEQKKEDEDMEAKDDQTGTSEESLSDTSKSLG